jgi:hypothetical protein
MRADRVVKAKVDSQRAVRAQLFGEDRVDPSTLSSMLIETPAPFRTPDVDSPNGPIKLETKPLSTIIN